MRVIILEDTDAVSLAAAKLIGELVSHKPSCTLGLATGGTPVATYRQLSRMHREERLSFQHVTTFNLDEYYGLPSSDPNSYRSFMNENLFHHIDIDLNRTHIPNGESKEIARECTEYETRIRNNGGIDLQLLGIGRDGHIAFNEPGSSLASRTRLMILAKETILDNARFFGTEDLVPKAALTMGVGTILEARKILLIATGASKAEAIQGCIEGPITSLVTASALQLHANVTVILDHAAAHLLERLEYYLDLEQVRNSLGVPPSLLD